MLIKKRTLLRISRLVFSKELRVYNIGRAIHHLSRAFSSLVSDFKCNRFEEYIFLSRPVVYFLFYSRILKVWYCVDLRGSLIPGRWLTV